MHFAPFCARDFNKEDSACLLIHATSSLPIESSKYGIQHKTTEYLGLSFPFKDPQQSLRGIRKACGALQFHFAKYSWICDSLGEPWSLGIWKIACGLSMHPSALPWTSRWTIRCFCSSFVTACLASVWISFTQEIWENCFRYHFARVGGWWCSTNWKPCCCILGIGRCKGRLFQHLGWVSKGNRLKIKKGLRRVSADFWKKFRESPHQQWLSWQHRNVHFRFLHTAPRLADVGFCCLFYIFQGLINSRLLLALLFNVHQADCTPARVLYFLGFLKSGLSGGNARSNCRGNCLPQAWSAWFTGSTYFAPGLWSSRRNGHAWKERCASFGALPH